MKSPEYKAPKMLTEGDHGLGINRAVPRVIVEELEQHIMNAATVAVRLGVNLERLNDLSEAAYDVAAGRHYDQKAAGVR